MRNKNLGTTGVGTPSKSRWMALADYDREPQKCAYSPCERQALPRAKVCEFHGIAYREQRAKERIQKKRGSAIKSETQA